MQFTRFKGQVKELVLRMAYILVILAAFSPVDHLNLTYTFSHKG